MTTTGDSLTDAPKPVLASDAAFLLPPPSYEEVRLVYSFNYFENNNNRKYFSWLAFTEFKTAIFAPYTK